MRRPALSTIAARLAAASIIALSVSACAGSRGGPPLLPDAGSAMRGAASKKTAKLTVRVRIPKHAHHRRRGRYISPATKGMTIAFTGAGTQTDAFALTTGSSNCSGSPLTCTFTVALVPGAYSATINTYDQAPVSGVVPGTAHVLSTAKNVSLAIVNGSANHAGFTLDGVPASISFGNMPKGYAGNGFLDGSFAVSAFDADANTIVGTYETPVTLADSDTGGNSSIQTSGPDDPPAGALLSSSDAATLSYTGKPMGAVTISATAGGAKGSTYFRAYDPVFVADTGNNELKDIPLGCVGINCVQTISGGGNTLAGVAMDANGELYYADNGTGDVIRMIQCNVGYCTAAIVATGFSGMHGIAIDATSQRLLISTGSSVELLTPACIKPSCALEIAHGTFNDPYAMAFDPQLNLYVADPALGQVIKVPSTCVASPGSACTTTALGGNTFVSPQGVATDLAGNVYVADTFGSVYQMSSACTTDSCVLTIGSGFLQPSSVAADAYGNVYVMDSGNNSVQVINEGCSGPGCQVSVGGGFSNPAAIALPVNT